MPTAASVSASPAIAKINLIVIDGFAISPIGPRERNDLLKLLN